MKSEIDIQKLSAAELKKLLKSAFERQSLIENRAPAGAVRKVILGYAAKEGYSIHELFGVGPATIKAARAPSPMKGAKLPILYRNPQDKAMTWTGRGRQPRWLAELLAAGRELNEFKPKKVYKPA